VTVTNDLGIPMATNNTLIDNSTWAATIPSFQGGIPLSPKWFYAALALSSFGNIVAMTFTIAGVVWKVRDAFCERPIEKPRDWEIIGRVWAGRDTSGLKETVTDR
jgi:hypothetical protein